MGQCPTWWPPCRIEVAPSVQRRKVRLAPTTRLPCSNAARTRNPLKLAGVPQKTGPISADSRPKFTILWRHLRRYCCLTSFFPIVGMCLSYEDRARKVARWCPDGEFLAIFWVLHFQQAACSTFQTCTLNSHYDHTKCRSTVDIQSATSEIRRGKRRRRRRQKTEETTGQKYKLNGLPYSIRRP